MPLDELQLRELITALKDASENARLKACDALAKLAPADRPSAQGVADSLRQVFSADPNPAVRFMAKKALSALGIPAEKPRPDDPGAKADAPLVPVPPAGPSRAAMMRELPVLWKCAQEEIRPCMAPMARLVWSAEPSVVIQTNLAFEKCGMLLASPILLTAFEQERNSPAWKERESQDSELYGDVRELIDLLKGQSSGVNPVVAAQMGNLQRPEVLVSFIDMLRSANPVLRDNAVRFLAELKDARTIDPLGRLLGSVSPDLDALIITTLSKIARSDQNLQIQILKKILAHFKPAEPEAKLFSIVEAVGRIANPKTLDFVRGCLRHPLPRVRANAVEALQNFDMTPDERQKLLAPLLKDDNNRVLGNAVVALWGTSSQDSVVGHVDRMAQHPDKWVRASLAFSMGVINAPGVVPYLLKLVTDPEDEVRRNAVKSIRRLSNREAILNLASHLMDQDTIIRLYCIEHVGRHVLSEHNADIKKIVEAAGDDEKTLSAGILALGRLRDPSNIDLIGRHLRHENGRVRANAVEALEVLNEPKVTPLIQASITDSDARTRANAVKALWKYGELWAAERAKAMLEGPTTEYQSSGAYALGEMADMSQTPSRLVNLPHLMMSLRRHRKYPEFKTLLLGNGA